VGNSAGLKAAVAVKTALPMDNGIETNQSSKVLAQSFIFLTEIQMLSKHHRLRWSLHTYRKRGFRPIQYAK
jgi:hypothetical protein